MKPFVPIVFTAALVACAGAPSDSPARSTPAGRLYVTNEMSGDLSVVDTASRYVVATIPLGKRPRGSEVRPRRRDVVRGTERLADCAAWDG